MGRFLLRVLIGGLFLGHGTQKLFGWFGGGGLEDTAGGFESMGMRPGKRHAAAAGAAEAGGGLLLALGLGTPLAAASVIGVMLTAIRKVHLPNGVLWGTGRAGRRRAGVLRCAVTGGPAGHLSDEASRAAAGIGLG